MSGRLKKLTVLVAAYKVKAAALLLVILCVAIYWPSTSFYRAVNLGGAGLLVGEDFWEGGTTSGVVYDGQACSLFLESFNPPAKKNLQTQVLRFGQLSRGGRNRVVFKNVPDGLYQVALYVVQKGTSQPCSISVKGQEFLNDYQLPPDQNWGKLGPWKVRVTDGSISVSSRGENLAFTGVEIHRQKSVADGIYRNLLQGSSAHRKNFENSIGPLLGRRCANCHNEADLKGGFDVTSRDALLEGGVTGPAFRLGFAEKSLFWKHISEEAMPPDAPLTEAEKKLFHEWILAGIPWGQQPVPRFSETTEDRAGIDWWSFQPLANSEPPSTNHPSWGNNEVDAFILSELQANGLTPSPEADRRTLIRRLYFDIVGLPPNPEQVQTFISDDSDKAYEVLVDSLLDSPHYGERWARHWLDVVRFGESQGFQRNWLRPDAWKYRDWVILALNNDMPYDEFVRLQIAGDLILPQDPMHAIATGFLVAGMFDMEGITSGPELMRIESRQQELADIVGTLGQTFLGLTVQCARCHDHKFDPITQREFYQLMATLTSIRQSKSQHESGFDIPANPSNEQKKEIDKIISTLEKELINLDSSKTANGETFDQRLYNQQSLKLSSFRMQSRLLEGGAIYAAFPDSVPDPIWVYRRGNVRQPTEVVPPAGLQRVGLAGADFDLTSTTSDRDRRLKLANWIAAPKNPLLARVIVNRIWQHHFGTALVETPNDFGFNGAYPSHPKLLDWLATILVENHWSLKALHRKILMSATWKQASLPRTDATSKDARNRLIWKHSSHRLEAEIIRDTVLSVSGQLNFKMGGPGFQDFEYLPHSEERTQEEFTPKDVYGPEFNRRSIYRTWIRGCGNSLLDSLDCPSPSTTVPKRLVTTTPLQALALLNNSFMRKSAKKFAERLKQEAGPKPRNQLELAYQLAFSRDIEPEELTSALKFIDEFGLIEFCLVLFNSNEFLFAD